MVARTMDKNSIKGGMWGGGVLELGQHDDNGFGRPLILMVVLAKMRIFDLVRIWLELGSCINAVMVLGLELSALSTLTLNLVGQGR
jgi:hypothetical protein